MGRGLFYACHSVRTAQRDDLLGPSHRCDTRGRALRCVSPAAGLAPEEGCGPRHHESPRTALLSCARRHRLISALFPRWQAHRPNRPPPRRRSWRSSPEPTCSTGARRSPGRRNTRAGTPTCFSCRRPPYLLTVPGMPHLVLTTVSSPISFLIAAARGTLLNSTKPARGQAFRVTTFAMSCRL